MKVSLKYLLFVAIFATLGFSREFVFVNINSRLFSLYYKNNDFILPNSLSIFSEFNYNGLYNLKYALTILFLVMYFTVSYFVVQQFYQNKKITNWVTYIYLILLALAGISTIYNYFFSKDLGGDDYTFSRWLMGIAQSPLVALFILASGKLYNKLQTERK